jgi:hypothetical protein
MHGFPELPPNAAMDPYSDGFVGSNINNNNSTNAARNPTAPPTQQQQQRQQHLGGTPNYGNPLMPPAPNDQHSYTGPMMHGGQSYATGMSDITTDPGY